MGDQQHKSGSIAERLVAMRAHFRMPQKEMSKRYGLGPSTWQRWEQLDEAPNAKVLEQLLRDGFDVHWVLTGEGTMRRARGEGQEEKGFSELSPMPLQGRDFENAGFVLVPRYDVKASAGGGTIYQEHDMLAGIAFRREWLHKALHANPADLLVIEARGDSMPGIADDGALLLLDKSEPKFRGDGAYVFVVDGLLLVKNLRVLLDGSLEVSSSDEHQSVKDVIPRRDLEKVSVVGRVIWRAGRA